MYNWYQANSARKTNYMVRRSVLIIIEQEFIDANQDIDMDHVGDSESTHSINAAKAKVGAVYYLYQVGVKYGVGYKPLTNRKIYQLTVVSSI